MLLRQRFEGLTAGVIHGRPEYIYAAAWNYANSGCVHARTREAVHLLMRQRESPEPLADLGRIPKELEYAPEEDGEDEESDTEPDLKVFADDEDVA